jgi:hypothetical protein
LITVKATDPHGAYNYAYITIKITDYSVAKWKNGAINGSYPDVTIYEYRRFTIPLADNLFYDQAESKTLVVYATD